MYLVAIIDVYSRKIIRWSVSNTMTKEWCIELLEEIITFNSILKIGFD